MTIFHQFHQCCAALSVQRLQAKVIQYKQVLSFNTRYFLNVRAVCFTHFKFGEQLRNIVVDHPVSPATCVMSKGGSNITFANTCTSCNEDTFSFINEATVCQPHDLVTVDVAIAIIVESLKICLVAEAGILYLLVYTTVLPVVPFSIYQVSDQLIRCIGFLLL